MLQNKGKLLMEKIEHLDWKIRYIGGYINAHSHLDRAYTDHEFTAKEKTCFLEEKWKLVDRIKKLSSYSDYKKRISHAIDMQQKYGVSAICTFVDLDVIVSYKAIIAARELRDERKDIKLVIANQTLKGVLDPQNANIIRNNAEFLDIIGSLPSADKGREEEHLDFVMGLAKRHNKLVHCHVDQLNCPSEKQTEMLARKTIQHGMEGKVTAIHSLSLACHQKSYREEVYKICKDANLMFVSCPSAWIDHQRKEELLPWHNALTPVDELLNHGLTVAVGTDNIEDVYKPYCNGDPLFELRILLEAFKIYDDDTLISLAVHNGKKALGLVCKN